MNRLVKIEELGFKCSIILADFHFWQNFNSYMSLMEEFLSKKISGKEFETRFYKIYGLDSYVDLEWEELVYVLSNFNLVDFDGLTNLISDLFVNCDSFEANLVLRDCVYEIFLKIKNRYVKS